MFGPFYGMSLKKVQSGGNKKNSWNVFEFVVHCICFKRRNSTK